jgi:tetratricopeptide (TPR) repeat protein
VQSVKAAVVLCLALATGSGLWYLQTWAPNRHWRLADELGRRLLSQEHYGEAERQFSLAVESARSFGERDPRRALSLFHLAQSLVGQSKLDEALPLLEQAVTIHAKSVGHENPDGQQMREYREALLQRLGTAARGNAEKRPNEQLTPLISDQAKNRPG